MLPFKTMLKERSLDKETLVITLPLIENVLLIDGLKQYFLSISQLSDKDLKWFLKLLIVSLNHRP